MASDEDGASAESKEQAVSQWAIGTRLYTVLSAIGVPRLAISATGYP
jgi:hypothetical protein